MKKIYFDDIIFLLQKKGGISNYWKSVTFFNSNNLNIERGPNFKYFYRFDFFKKFLKYFPVFNKSFDVYHSSYQRILLFKGHTKIVLTIHDCIYEIYETGIKKIIHQLFTGLALRQADVIICVSQSTKSDLINFYPFAKNKFLKVIHNGVNPKKVEESNLVNIKKFILYVGNRGYCKDFLFQLNVAIDFLKEHSDFFFYVVGGGAWNKNEINIIKSSGVQEQIILDLNVSNEKLNSLYKKSHALLFLSRYEGFGIPLIEAFNMKCPVICSNVSSIPEIVGQDYEGMFDKSNKKGIHDYMNELFEKKNRIRVINYIESRSKLFYWDKSMLEHIKIYESL